MIIMISIHRFTAAALRWGKADKPKRIFLKTMLIGLVPFGLAPEIKL